ncbi:hypothetical protein JCM19241_106 [Vibrio ishigakensis]|uniref:Uncharacterized protein n=1 Tax=Vibrio ishigakensis TaxID=1481914 RepID=A0A0B8QL51_9VIBR|nr:hypothetical protein JCM19241_106 [Vibrio ishigakensis]
MVAKVYRHGPKAGGPNYLYRFTNHVCRERQIQSSADVASAEMTDA